jgi:hypothetical protein
LFPEDEKKSEKKLLASPLFNNKSQQQLANGSGGAGYGKPPECIQSLFEMARHYFLSHWDACVSSDDVNGLPKDVLIDLMRAKSMNLTRNVFFFIFFLSFGFSCLFVFFCRLIQL